MAQPDVAIRHNTGIIENAQAGYPGIFPPSFIKEDKLALQAVRHKPRGVIKKIALFKIGIEDLRVLVDHGRQGKAISFGNFRYMKIIL
jgi:hypothetical protein